MYNKRFGQLLRVFGKGAIIIFFSQLSILAVPRGAQTPWSKVEGRDLGDVNLFSGALNFGIPLLDVEGRGTTKIPLILRLGKQWKKYVYTYLDPNSGAPYSYKVTCVMDDDGNAPDISDCVDENGFKVVPTDPNPVKVMVFPSLDDELDPGYGPGFLVGKSISTNSVWCNDDVPIGTTQTGRYRPSAARFSLSFNSPDGSQHELVDQNTMGQFRTVQGGLCGQYPSGQDFSRGTKFVSTDGTSMTFISDVTAPPDWDYISAPYGYESTVNVSGILHTSDGSQIRIDNDLISWIKDRNGNITTFSYYSTESFPFGKLHTITDSAGRVVTIEYDVQDVSPFGLCDRITYKGTGGQDRILRISKSNLSDNLRSGYSLKTKYEMFPAPCAGVPGCGTSTPFDTTVISTLWLPDGRSYKFQYNSFVEIARVEYPTGMAVEIDHDYGDQKQGNYLGYPLSRRVSEKRVYGDLTQASLQNKSKYLRTITGGWPSGPTNTISTVDTTDANDNLIVRKVSHFSGDPKISMQEPDWGAPFGMPSWKDGLEQETDVFASDGTTLLKRVSNEWQQKTLPWITDGSSPAYDPTLASTSTLLADENLISKQVFAYDTFCNLTDKYEYDFGSGQPGALLRRTHTDYIADDNYTSSSGSHLRNLPIQTWVSSDVAGTVIKNLTRLEYDNYTSDFGHAPIIPRDNVSGFDSTGYGSSLVRRGNVTSSTSYTDAGSQTGAVNKLRAVRRFRKCRPIY